MQHTRTGRTRLGSLCRDPKRNKKKEGLKFGQVRGMSCCRLHKKQVECVCWHQTQSKLCWGNNSWSSSGSNSPRSWSITKLRAIKSKCCHNCNCNMPRYQQLVNESNNNSPQQQHSEQPPSVGYHLYLYREQLARRKVEYMRLSKAKYFITETLLAKNWRNLKGCSADDLKTVNNQIVFKHKLRHQIHRLRKLQNLGIRNANPHMESTELWDSFPFPIPSCRTAPRLWPEHSVRRQCVASSSQWRTC